MSEPLPVRSLGQRTQVLHEDLFRHLCRAEVHNGVRLTNRGAGLRQKHINVITDGKHFFNNKWGEKLYNYILCVLEKGIKLILTGGQLLMP